MRNRPSRHATKKKSPAQLDQEIAEALSKHDRKAILVRAQRASAAGDYATAAKLFASVGISYIPFTSN
jgi:hypothetical protein